MSWADRLSCYLYGRKCDDFGQCMGHSFLFDVKEVRTWYYTAQKTEAYCK
ncbi:hypothetical protein ACVXZY_11850 [Staphylococcus aureus]